MKFIPTSKKYEKEKGYKGKHSYLSTMLPSHPLKEELIFFLKNSVRWPYLGEISSTKCHRKFMPMIEVSAVMRHVSLLKKEIIRDYFKWLKQFHFVSCEICSSLFLVFTLKYSLHILSQVSIYCNLFNATLYLWFLFKVMCISTYILYKQHF